MPSLFQGRSGKSIVLALLLRPLLVSPLARLVPGLQTGFSLSLLAKHELETFLVGKEYLHVFRVIGAKMKLIWHHPIMRLPIAVEPPKRAASRR